MHQGHTQFLRIEVSHIGLASILGVLDLLIYKILIELNILFDHVYVRFPGKLLIYLYTKILLCLVPALVHLP